MKAGGTRARARFCALLALALGLALACPLPARAGQGAPASVPATAAAAAITAPPGATPTTLATPAAPVELWLEVSVNGAATGAVARFTRGAQGLRVDADTLRELGLDPATLGFGEARERDLDAIPGLRYSFDAAAQSISLRLADDLRTPLRLQARNPREVGAGSASPGLLLNYDIYAQPGAGSGTDSRASALHELRWFDARGALSSTGVATLHGPGRRYLRHDTSWNWADPVALTSLQVGDLITRSLTWSRSLRIGGIEWRKNFDLRPDLVTYPMTQIAGSAVVPSSVSLYVNGMQQFSSTVPDGPFVLDQVAGLNGAGQATVVTRDSLGREVATSVPLYVDTRLLAPGLSDYAVAFGLPRRDYGLRSFSYAARPAFTGSLRHGVNDALTVEAHAEAAAGVANAGAGALIRLGHAGVLHGALAASGGGGSGAQATLGYQYLSPRFSIDVQSTRASSDYADLGTREGVPVNRVNDRITANFSPSAGQSLSASLVAYRLAGRDTARIASLAWSMRLGEGVYLGVNAYQDLGQTSARGVTASLSFSLPGRIGASVGAGRRAGQPSWNLGLNRSADFAGGFGWNLQSATQAGQRYGQGQLQYLGSAGQLGLLVQDGGAGVTAAFNATGALVAMDGAVLPARQVGRAFAMVSAGVADVPVLQENRVIGRTDRNGRLLVPDLVPYAANQLAIDASGLPLDMRVRATNVEIAPRLLSGVVAGFALERVRAASVTVHGADGKPVAIGTPVEVNGGDSTIVGHDGMVFVEQAGAQNRLVLRAREGACEVRFRYPAAGDGAAGGGIATIGPLRCMPIEGGK